MKLNNDQQMPTNPYEPPDGYGADNSVVRWSIDARWCLWVHAVCVAITAFTSWVDRTNLPGNSHILPLLIPICDVTIWACPIAVLLTVKNTNTRTEAATCVIAEVCLFIAQLWLALPLVS